MRIPVLTLLLLACCVSGCRRDKIVQREIIVWRPVNTWAGRSNLQTESFTSETGSFQVHWVSKPDPGPASGHLKITLHSAVSGRPLSVVMEHDGPGEETVFASDDPREFFLVIDAERTNWSVKLDEGVRATQRTVVKQ